MPPPLPQIEGVEHRYETVGGVRIHYAEAGAGEPLLLVHGWPQNWWMWRKLIGPLAERYRVIAPDLRGHGWSDKPAAASYTKLTMLGDMLGLLDRLGIERIRWVGHDWGAWVGMLGALHAPERIERLVTMAIPHPWMAAARDPRYMALGAYQVPLGGPWGRFVIQRTPIVRAMLRSGRSIGAFSAEEVALYEGLTREDDATRATVRIYRDFMLREMRGWRRLGRMRLTVPALWLVGTEDLLAHRADDGHRGHADAMTVEHVEGANHFMPDELPELVLERLLAFL